MRPMERILWTGMLDAELGSAYFGTIAGRAHAWDIRMKLFLAFTSSGTVAGWSFWNDPAAHPNLVLTWKMLSGLSAVVAVAMPLLNLAKKVEWATSLHYGYAKILTQYEMAWAKSDKMSEPELESVLKELHRQEDALIPIESHFPKSDAALNRKCQQNIIRRRGLTK